MQFRKRPATIEAIEWDGTAKALDDIRALGDRKVEKVGEYLDIFTSQGLMRALVGDWIIRGIKGDIYPCIPDIFAATYEPLE